MTDATKYYTCKYGSMPILSEKDYYSWKGHIMNLFFMDD
jgi:hypothetical protein